MENVDGFEETALRPLQNVDGFMETSTVCMKRRRFHMERRRLWQLGVYKTFHTTPKIIFGLSQVA